MGLLLSKEEARLRKLDALINEAWAQVLSRALAVAADKAAGIPPWLGNSQALRAAAVDYAERLDEERRAIWTRLGVRRPVLSLPQAVCALNACGTVC